MSLGPVCVLFNSELLVSEIRVLPYFLYTRSVCNKTKKNARVML